MKNEYQKKIGSGTLVVILAALTFLIYVSSAYTEQEHLYILQNKYEKSIVEFYEKDYNNINEYYQKVYDRLK